MKRRIVTARKLKRVVSKKLYEVLFGKIAKGEKVGEAETITVYPDGQGPDRDTSLSKVFEWMKEHNVSSRTHRKPIYFE